LNGARILSTAEPGVSLPPLQLAFVPSSILAIVAYHVCRA